MSYESRPGRFKLVKTQFATYGVRVAVYLNPREVASVTSQYETFVQAKSMIHMRDGRVHYSEMEPHELAAEIEEAANG